MTPHNPRSTSRMLDLRLNWMSRSAGAAPGVVILLGFGDEILAALGDGGGDAVGAGVSHPVALDNHDRLVVQRLGRAVPVSDRGADRRDDLGRAAGVGLVVEQLDEAGDAELLAVRVVGLEDAV